MASDGPKNDIESVSEHMRKPEQKWKIKEQGSDSSVGEWKSLTLKTSLKRHTCESDAGLELPISLFIEELIPEDLKIFLVFIWVV